MFVLITINLRLMTINFKNKNICFCLNPDVYTLKKIKSLDLFTIEIVFPISQ